MTTIHLTDAEIQQYVSDANTCGIKISGHITECKDCETKAANYATLFEALQEQPVSNFDIDITALVMAKLPAPAQPRLKNSYFIPSVIVVASGGLCIPVYQYWPVLVKMFNSMQGMVILLLLLPVAAIFIFQLTEIHKNYKTKMTVLQ